jgi:hypothetical protein
MSDDSNPYYEVIPQKGKYQVVLMEDEHYRDQPGNIRKRRVATRFYQAFDTPLDAQLRADLWNRMDGNVKAGAQ